MVRALLVIAVIAAGVGGATRADAQVFRPTNGKVVLANPIAAKAIERSPIVLAQHAPGAAAIAPAPAATPGATPAIAAATPGAPPAAPAAPKHAAAVATAPAAAQPAARPKRTRKVKKTTDDGDDVVIVDDDDDE